MEKNYVAVGELASHSHYADRADAGNMKREQLAYTNGTNIQYNRPEAIQPTGGDMPHNNISPCVGAYLWRRTA
mgnify:CR=1 FL=1